MILDKELILNDNTALTNTQVSTNIIDLGAVRDIGAGEPLELLVQVTSALLSAGASTLVVALQTDTQSSFATAVTLYTTASIAKAALVAGYQPIRMKLPEGVQRYIRLSYTVGTADFTGGNIYAGLLLDKMQPLIPAYYPSGLNTSGF